MPKATTNHKKKDLEIDSHVDLVKPKAESIADNPDAVQSATQQGRIYNYGA